MSYQRPVSIRPDLITDDSIHLDGMARIAPAANIPPRLRLFVLNEERNEKPLLATQLPRFQ